MTNYHISGQYSPKVHINRSTYLPSRIDICHHYDDSIFGEPKMTNLDKWTLGFGIAGSIMAGLNDILGMTSSSGGEGGVVANTPEEIHALQKNNLLALAGNSGAIILDEPDGKFRVYDTNGEAKTDGPVDYETALEAVRSVRSAARSQAAQGASQSGAAQGASQSGAAQGAGNTGSSQTQLQDVSSLADIKTGLDGGTITLPGSDDKQNVTVDVTNKKIKIGDTEYDIKQDGKKFYIEMTPPDGTTDQKVKYYIQKNGEGAICFQSEKYTPASA